MTNKDVGLVLLLLSAWATGLQLSECEVTARTESGYVCGRLRPAVNGDTYASFRGVPYAKQPLGKLRFQELQPPESFDGVFDAREAGPVCPQVDIIYGPLLQPRSMGEDCIRINIHVPSYALPDPAEYGQTPLLPILAWVHGGSFSYGSGDAEFHGPEYLMSKGVILVTFNYRLNALGFLSLNSKSIPGNNGLRDARTALQWLQRNARFFGGDPGNVTIGGQSAGGAMAHLLSISPACEGLFTKTIALSGTAIGNFFTISPTYSALLAKLFLAYLNINILEDPEVIHHHLLKVPIENILEANKFLLDLLGLVTFSPVIETPVQNFTTMLPSNAESLLDEGRGKEFPVLFGFTSNEAQIFRHRLVHIDMVTKLRLLPVLIVPLNLLFTADPLSIPALTLNFLNEYYNNSFITLDQSLNVHTDSVKYAVLRAIEKRLETGSAPTFFYEFAYDGQESVVKKFFQLEYPGAGHMEDLTYIFRVNVAQGPLVVNELSHSDPDSMMREWMTTFITNFVKNGDPTPIADMNGVHPWPEADRHLRSESIEMPMFYITKPPSPYLAEKKRFFDTQYRIARG